MAYYASLASHGTTGVKTEPVGFQPQCAKITVGSQFGTTNTVARFSTGRTDGTNQFNHSLFADGTGRQTVSKADRMVSVWERQSGTLVEVLRVNFDSFTATQFKYNVTTANANYQLDIEVWG
jgi:hypothetical protein